MAIAKMTKVIIASYRDEAGVLLEKLQKEGIIEILNAEQAMVSKEWPELQVEIKRPRGIEDLVGRLKKSITFLKANATEKDSANLFNPRIEIDKSKYTDIVSGKEAKDLLDETEKVSTEIEDLNTDYENKQGVYETLHPWRELDTPVEELRNLGSATCLTGMLPHQHFDEITERLAELGGALEQVGSTGSMHACVVVCLNDAVSDAQKILRSGDFEPVNFEHFSGTVAKALDDCEEQLARIGVDLGNTKQKAAELAKDRLSLQILFDHNSNLLIRKQTQITAPATENTVLLEGWIKEHDYAKAEKIVNSFEASSIGKMDLAKDEEVPVEIENSKAFRPFEVLTRLHGMPLTVEVDPTIFLAPFFALFFSMCLTDAGYAIVMAAVIAFMMYKMRGDNKLLALLLISSVVTIGAGALTGGWFGDAIQQFVPSLNGVREKMMWFDPLEKPMIFFGLSLGLGFFQLVFGLSIAFFHKISRKEYISAVCDHLTWIVFLNSFVLIAIGVAVPSLSIMVTLGKFLILAAAITILFFSQREGGIAGRLGMGAYNLFSAIFYVGDILSYVRLMALGITTAGLAMAINVIAKVVGEIPGIGFVLTIIVLILGHIFNILMSALGAFVHSLRLQYVEFFSKFYVGGGKIFKPLTEKYEHINLNDK